MLILFLSLSLSHSIWVCSHFLDLVFGWGVNQSVKRRIMQWNFSINHLSYSIQARTPVSLSLSLSFSRIYKSCNHTLYYCFFWLYVCVCATRCVRLYGTNIVDDVLILLLLNDHIYLNNNNNYYYYYTHTHTHTRMNEKDKTKI